MLVPALAAFATGAVAGVFLAVRHFLRKRLPVWVALAHGLGGATGFTLLLLTVVWQPELRLARQALYLFIVTIALGCVNLLFHIRKVRHRTSLIVMHALCAVSGVLTLIYAIWAHEPSTAAAAPPALPPSSAASLSANPAPATASAAPAEAPAASAPAPEPSASGAPAKAAAEPQELDAAVQSALGASIAFESKSVTPAPDSLGVIDAIANALKQHPEVRLLEVQGHADARGDDASNIELTRLRAGAVIEALVRRGVVSSRLRSAAYGSRCPIAAECARADAPASCQEPERLKQDRRVVVVPLQIGKTALRRTLACENGQSLIPPADRPFHLSR